MSNFSPEPMLELKPNILVIKKFVCAYIKKFYIKLWLF